MIEPTEPEHLDEAVRALTRSARMLDRALPDISMADFRMLSAISDGIDRASRLAGMLALGKPAVSATVDSLVRRGLLARQTREDDRRAVDLALTDRGARTLQDARAALAGVVLDIAGHTPDAEATLAALAVFGEGVRARHQERRAARENGTCAGSEAAR
ncbi:MAG: MarR family transcriptional regulator [Microbacterium sp.]|uniref:MarR family winged helix-turn-helix transcriptional regulator n=1 Tax=Microbacterium sp. TaxID=51671 RepID=UPI0039E6B8A0